MAEAVDGSSFLDRSRSDVANGLTLGIKVTDEKLGSGNLSVGSASNTSSAEVINASTTRTWSSLSCSVTKTSPSLRIKIGAQDRARSNAVEVLSEGCMDIRCRCC